MTVNLNPQGIRMDGINQGLIKFPIMKKIFFLEMISNGLWTTGSEHQKHVEHDRINKPNQVFERCISIFYFFLFFILLNLYFSYFLHLYYFLIILTLLY